ncbi:Zinc finger, RING-type [Dillenia turbinata]|uniref:RING-type E3 ubiquitin transferase n=1 Tax=Dillenia turbinata TaxID=194707 RepID=A0AAN8UT72_9MAGN
MSMSRSSSHHDMEVVVVDNRTPLLISSAISERLFRSRRFVRRPNLRGAARFLGRRRAMRETSARVRETAAEQLEERHSDWAYSKPIVILDIVWNSCFIVLATTVMVLSGFELPSMPLRLWIVGYALQCVLHVLCVCLEYKRRRGFPVSDSSSSLDAGNDGRRSSGDFVGEQNSDEDGTSVAKHLESANTMFSFIWWIIGFYWVSSGGPALARDSPQLYWLCITFLAFDVVFVVMCVAVACLIGIAVCCCLPCIIAILYAVADQEGASKEDIDRLTKYKFHKICEYEKPNGEIQESFGGIMTECDTDSPTDHVLSLEDAECCICLSAYDDGAELRELPCHHHFHCACIDKWLYINATCPLCKFNILKSGSEGSCDEV